MSEQLNEYHILIVEDNGINRFILMKMLKELGKPITETEDGGEALQALDTLKDRNTILLLDLNMPVLDGYSVIRKIAADTAAYAKVKIVVVTGTMYNDFQKTGLDSHINGYVEKPVEKDELIGQIKKCATEF